MQTVPELYKKYFIDNGIERLELFKLIKDKYRINRVLYPGSFVHIAPSFFFQEVVYLDLDKRCKKFFSQKETIAYIESKKEYNQKSIVKYYEMSFEEELEEEFCSFDLLVSQFAGFISIHCIKYLKKNGILLVNDSHGDATMAYCSGKYDLIGVINNENNFEDESLNEYFIFSRKREISIEDIKIKMKGPKYKNNANSYIFRKR